MPGPPFRVFSPPGRSILPKSPFQVFDLASFLSWFLFFFVFLDHDCILLKAEVLSIMLSHVSFPECNCSRGGCWCTLQLLTSSKRVCLLFTLFKRCKKKFCILKFLLQVFVIKNRRNFANKIKWEFQINGHRLKFDELSGDPPMARLHRFWKIWKMVNIWEGYIEHSNRYSP